MLSLFKRYRELLVVGFLLLFPFSTYLSRGGRAQPPNVLDRGLISLSSWLQGAMIWSVEAVVGGFHDYVALRGVRAENVALRQQNAQLLAQVQALVETRAENERLRALLAFAEKAKGLQVAARVIGVNPVPTLLSVRIDRGEADGVRKGMPVVTSEGAVGYVERATGSHADVVLLRDRNTTIGVRVDRSRVRANAVGAGKELALKLENALRTDDFRDGDVVVTSGTDGIYPPGLVVGRLANVARGTYGMFQAADIVPAVDTTRLEEVLVLVEAPVAAEPAGGAP